MSTFRTDILSSHLWSCPPQNRFAVWLNSALSEILNKHNPTKSTQHFSSGYNLDQCAASLKGASTAPIYLLSIKFSCVKLLTCLSQQANPSTILVLTLKDILRCYYGRQSKRSYIGLRSLLQSSLADLFLSFCSDMISTLKLKFSNIPCSDGLSYLKYPPLFCSLFK